VPREIIVYGIEVQDPFSLGNEVSPALSQGIEDIAREIADDFTGGG
jgi:hypothetical protein